MWQAIALLGSKLLSSKQQQGQQNQQALDNTMASEDTGLDNNRRPAVPGYDKTTLDWENL